MKLSDLSKNTSAVIRTITNLGEHDFIARRLQDLGFVPGEQVRVMTRAAFGADPILVGIGDSRFALRRAEAARICVEME